MGKRPTLGRLVLFLLVNTLISLEIEMNKIQVKEVEIFGSECTAVNGRSFSSIIEADSFIRAQICIAGMTFAKTMIRIIWEDDFMWTTDNDYCSGETVIDHFFNLNRIYTSDEMPFWFGPMTAENKKLDNWKAAKADWAEHTSKRSFGLYDII
jgi:hypothetical protein